MHELYGNANAEVSWSNGVGACPALAFLSPGPAPKTPLVRPAGFLAVQRERAGASGSRMAVCSVAGGSEPQLQHLYDIVCIGAFVTSMSFDPTGVHAPASLAADSEPMHGL